jgi:surface protein
MKKGLLLGLVTIITICANAQEFITRWDLSFAGSTSSSISFNVGTTGVVNYVWETIPAGFTGNGTFSGSTATITGLPVGAIIRLKIDSANFNRFYIHNGYYNGLDRNRLIDVEQWGTINWSSMENAFNGCEQLNITSTDLPNLSNLTSMLGMFMNCSSLSGPSNINSWNTSQVTSMKNLFANTTPMGCIFNQPIGNWNMSNVTNLDSMFCFAYNFNQPIDTWDVSNVTSMKSTFEKAYNFNQPIGNWNTSQVTNMSHLFSTAMAFNQPIGNWDVSNVTNMEGLFNSTHIAGTHFNQPISNWDVSNVTDMNKMFYRSYDFNQPLDNWDVSNVSNMQEMFAFSLDYNQSLGNWHLNSTVQMDDMLNGCGMDCSNYSATLYNWSHDILCPSNVHLGANGLYYGPNVMNERINIINTKNWVISGDLINLNVCCFTINTSINQAACNAYIFNNQTLTQGGVFYDTIINSFGCDIVITLHLTIHQTTNSTSNQTACNSYFFNNQTLTQSGMYYDTLSNSTGCDSIITLNLTINNVNKTTTQNGTQLSAIATGASYQWLTCNPFAIIAGATNQTYSAAANGDYAVVLTQNGCTDTSFCLTVTGVGIEEPNTQTLITISPNPTHTMFNIECPMNSAKVILYNSFGQKLLSTKIEHHAAAIDISQYPNGIYLAEIIDDKTTYRIKVTKD